MKQLTLSQATACPAVPGIEGFLLEKQARHLSPHTVADYTNAFRKLQAYLGTDVVFAGITAGQIRGFLGDLATPRAPNGAARRPVKGLSNKTILNIHTALSALWTWAVSEGIVAQHILRQIPRPKPEKRAITPFSEELNKIGTAEELEIASLRRDGTLRNPVTIWVVRLGDDFYVRSVNGRTGAWSRGELEI
jgi:site-specific recombinase XerD